MPFRSEAQRAWAHATGQPWADEWDKETGKKKLPKKKKPASKRKRARRSKKDSQ